MSEANGTRKNRKNNLSEAKEIKGGGISFFNPSPERTISYFTVSPFLT